MSKRIHKHPPHLPPRREPEIVSAEASLERGRQAFHTERFGEAIKWWERVVPQHPEIVPALAEAYFRRAVAPTAAPAQQIPDLQRATALAPNDACYYYHLGLAQHRKGERDTALVAYQIAADANPQQRGLAFTFALTKLETDPNADVSTLAGLNESEREIIHSLAMLLRGDTSFLRAAESRSWFQALLAKLGGANPTLALWRGLGFLLADDYAAAERALNTANRLTPQGEALRHYYLGILHARRGDWSAAQLSWEQARARGLDTVWLRENQASAHLPNAIAAVQAKNWKRAVDEARAVLKISPTNSDATQIVLIALDHLAHIAADAGNWAQAAAQWNEANQVNASSRPILQNLAIASEMSEAWAQAAEAWRAMLRTKPRSKKAADPFSDAHWNWIRKRATQDLQKAGRLGEAITLMKQKIKLQPTDLAARMELVDALLANQQETAARNELQRILQADPQYRDARLKLAEWHTARKDWSAAEMEMQYILEQEPTNEPARKQMAYLLVQRGRAVHQGGRVAAARDVFERALKYAPDNADIYIDLGRAALDLRQPAVARQDFEQAYRLGAKQISTHEQIVRCWALARDLAEVKNALARAEKDIQPQPLLYIHTGIACLEIHAAPPSPFALRSVADPEWERFGKELVERGIAFKPDDPELLHHIVMDFADAQSRLGLPYAERLAKLTPDDPQAWLMLGMFQLSSGQLGEAKTSLAQAGRLARRQGNREIEQAANQVRRELNNPMLSMALNLGLPLDGLFGESPDGEFEDADEFLFGRTPHHRSKRR